MIDSASQFRPQVVGILSPGEMGRALAEVLKNRRLQIVTTLSGRSERTRRLCAEAGLESGASLGEVVRQADVILSVVTPAAALPLAQQVRTALQTASEKSRVFIESNSISPLTMQSIAEEFIGTQTDVVDVGIHGIASRLTTQGTIFASGPRAELVAELFGTEVSVRQLGDEIGKASLHKMLLGGMSKGFIALFLQAALAAQKAGLLKDFLRDLKTYYPDIAAFTRRSLPSYPKHASRRSDEMGEWAATLDHLHLPSGLASEIQTLFLRLVEGGLDDAEVSSAEDPVTDLISLIADRELLRAAPAPLTHI